MTGGGASTGDGIEIRGLRVMVHVGVTDDERAAAQPVEVDVDLRVDLARPGTSDSVTDTVDYGVVATAVDDALRRRPCALLERLATVAADAALEVDPRTIAATVTVRKLRPPVPLDVASLGVRVHRDR